MERKFGYQKMLNHSTKTQRTKILPLRWIGNICGEFAGNHIVKCVNMNDDEEYGFRYKYHAKMWKYLNKPYEWWGTYYTIDMDVWKKDLEQIKKDVSGQNWDDYDEDGDIGFSYKYHAYMWKYLNKPYEWWGTYYILDIKEENK